MKRFTILALLCLSSFLCKAQFNWYSYIGKSRDSIRAEEVNQKINLIMKGISDKGFQYEMYSIFSEEDAWQPSDIFYYDINYVCFKVRLILSRDNASDFIDKTLNVNLHRLNNTTWISNDAKFVVVLTINSGDNYVTFDYMKKEDFLKS